MVLIDSMDPEKLQSEIHQILAKITRIIAVKTDDNVESKLAKLISVCNVVHGCSDLLKTIIKNLDICSDDDQVLPDVELLSDTDDGNMPVYDFGRQESQLISESQLALTRSPVSSSKDTLHDRSAPAVSLNNHEEEVFHTTLDFPKDELVSMSDHSSCKTEDSKCLVLSQDNRHLVFKDDVDKKRCMQIISSDVKDGSTKDSGCKRSPTYDHLNHLERQSQCVKKKAELVYGSKKIRGSHKKDKRTDLQCKNVSNAKSKTSASDERAPAVPFNNHEERVSCTTQDFPKDELVIMSNNGFCQTEERECSVHDKRLVISDDVNNKKFVQIISSNVKDDQAEDSGCKRSPVYDHKKHLERQPECVKEKAEPVYGSKKIKASHKKAKRGDLQCKKVSHTKPKTPASDRRAPAVSLNNHEEEAFHTTLDFPKDDLVSMSDHSSCKTEESACIVPSQDRHLVFKNDVDKKRCMQIISSDVKDERTKDSGCKRSPTYDHKNHLEIQSDCVMEKAEPMYGSKKIKASHKKAKRIDLQCKKVSHTKSKTPASEREKSTKNSEKTGKKGKRCAICNKRFVTLDVHMRRIHKKEKTKKCKFCGFLVFDTNTLNYHIRDMHTHAHHHKCAHCGKGFNRNSMLVKHLAKYPNGVCIRSHKSRKARKVKEKILNCPGEG